MGGKNIVLAIVALIILVAAGVILYRQYSAEEPPPAVMQATSEKIQAAEPFEVREFTNAEWMEASVDQETGYRKIDGQLWAEKTECISCGKAIPAAPIKVGHEGPLQLGKHKCPRCGEPAYMTD